VLFVVLRKLVNPTILGQITKLKKRLVSYFESRGMPTLKKHVNWNHFLITKNSGKKLNNNVKKLVERQLVKKKGLQLMGMKFLNSLGP
jgi:hypothetical protein